MGKKDMATVAALVAALAVSAGADERAVTTRPDRPDTVKIQASGDLILDYVWRSAELTPFTDAVGASSPASSDSENSVEGRTSIRLDVQMSNQVSAVVAIGTERVDSGINEWGNATAEVIHLLEAHVTVGEFLTKSLTLEAGITTWSFDVRGRGNSFAFDPRHSESITENFQSVEDGGGALGDRAGDPNELDPVGLWLNYVRGPLAFDLVILPAAIEGGAPSDDEALYAIDGWYTIDKDSGSRVGVILGVTAVPTNDTDMITVGGGAVLKNLHKALELYGEIYFQTGSLGTGDAEGLALQLGGEWNFGGSIAPWVGANFTMISGDDDAAASLDSDVGFFMSYENINDLLIIEDQYFGLDWDSNMTAIKLSGGLAMSILGGKKNLDLSAILGFCSTTEDVVFGTGSEDALGTEIDVRSRLHLTDQASLSVAIALLTGSDILEQSMAAASSHRDDSALLYTIGAGLRF